jgi:hypothetical protein
MKGSRETAERTDDNVNANIRLPNTAGTPVQVNDRIHVCMDNCKNEWL